MRFPAVKNCENLLRFDKVIADYKAVPFFPDTVYICDRMFNIASATGGSTRLTVKSLAAKTSTN